LAMLVISCLAGGLYYWKQLTANQNPININTISPNSVAIQQKQDIQHLPPVKTEAERVKPAITSKPVATKPTITFNEWLDNPALTLNEGIANALKAWKKDLPDGQQTDCEYAQKIGLNCLFNKGNWKDLLTHNRPAILEFSISPDTKRFALLNAINDGQPTLTFNGNHTFPLAEMLTYWDGYYVLIWQSPIPVKMLYPGQTSPHIFWLRQQLKAIDGINQEGNNPHYFDTDLKARVVNFQRAHHLMQDGKVGMQTIFHLDTATGATGSPHLKQD
jgi:general secretion pathway protein A